MEALLFRDTQHTAIVERPIRLVTGSFNTGRRRIERFINSSPYLDDSTAIILKENNQDDNLIRLRENFNNELNKFNEETRALASESFERSLFHLSKVSPDKIIVEVTDDYSLYYSMIKNDFTIFLEEDLDDKEVLVSLFKNDIKQKSLSGNIESVTSRLRDIISY